MLKGKKIIIGITGSIAAYKIPFLVRLLKKERAEVQIILTPFAKEFVTPLTLSTLSEKPVLSDFFVENDGSWHSHVELGLWADLILVAPLTANTMAKMANGAADNLLLTTILSARCPVYFAPAMDLDMFRHPTTEENISKLQSFGYHLIEPVEGELASGLKGVGRLEEPENIFKIIQDALSVKQRFEGKKVLITAGPTHEPIDPVRFIGNQSTGKMGVEIARAFAERGATVELVLGPSSLEIADPNIHATRVITADEMYDACMTYFTGSDIAVLSAAVADFKPTETASRKIKKEKPMRSLKLEPTKDILAELGKKKKKNQFLTGFALESDDEEANALKKLRNKNLDLIVLNSLKDEGAGFGTATNKVTLFSRGGEKVELPLQKKEDIADQLVDHIATLVNPK